MKPHPSSARQYRIKQRFLGRIAALSCSVAFLSCAQADPTNSPTDGERKVTEKETDAASKEKAATFVHEHRSDLVFIKGKSALGSGFIAEMKGRKVLISNAHVVAHVKNPAFELLDRTAVRVGVASVAKGHDLAAFVVIEGGTGIPTSTAVDTEARIGDAVIVLGNTTGGGVVNPLHGELLGIGPDRIEISAAFERGNSGSPIVHLRSGKVIGVAAYAKSDTLLLGDEKLRRFGFRLDSVKAWELIQWPRFYSEADSAEKIENATREFAELLSEFPTVAAAKKEAARSFESPAIRTALESFYGTLAQDSSAGDSAARKLLTSLRDACKNDVSAAKSRFTYDYFQRQLSENERVRGEFIEAIDKVLKQ